LNKHDVVIAIAKSIQLYKNADTMEKAEILELAKEISELGIFSNRQIEKMAHNKITHLAIGKVTGKTSKSGGKLNPATLEMIRDLIFQFNSGKIDWNMVDQVVLLGTSQSLVSKLTGISKTQINRRFVEKSI
jgi:hypothetical protein